jgi:para-aminobenzoate synthetase/4-amino-4-deoxychorismate lyase
MSSQSDVILLDDVKSTKTNPTSRVYEKCEGFLEVSAFDDVVKGLKRIQLSLDLGLHVVCCFSYELGLHFQGVRSLAKPPTTPLIRAWFFRHFERLSSEDAESWVNNRINFQKGDNLERSGLADIKFEVDEGEFKNRIDEIHQQIKLGNTYQVNYTFRVTGTAYGSVTGLYNRLRKRQPCQYAALFDCKKAKILSFSPELFLSKVRVGLQAKPMKGTLSSMQHQADDLRFDEKNRAENVMIVDLLRNDLSKVSNNGSVRVSSLFDVENIGQIFQMTSTIDSTVSPSIKISDLLEATFPCGSVTGAPKKRTMEIIDKLEKTERGIYCGSVGWFDPDPYEGNKNWNCMLNVAIRTLEVDNHRFFFGVGSGVTIDSESHSEWNECLLKSNFFVQLPSSVGIFETLLMKNGALSRFELHIDRLIGSASNLGIPLDVDELENELSNYLKKRQGLLIGEWKLKIILSPMGNLSFQSKKLERLSENQKCFWATDLLGNEFGTMNSKNPLLRHKTDARVEYNLAFEAAIANGGFDAIFLNEKGEVTEGGRSNIFLKKNGILQTPHQGCGLLPGIIRGEILKGNYTSLSAVESTLTRKDVLEADEVFLCNSLRGLFEVNLMN